MENGKKIVGFVSFLILVVVGVVAVVQPGNTNDHKGNHSGGGSGGGGGGISTSTKTQLSSNMFITPFCALSLYKDECTSSLLPLSNIPNPSIKDYLSTTLGSTLLEMTKSIDIVSNVTINKDDDPYNDQMGIDDCKEFLSYAVEELENAVNWVADGEIQTLQDHVQTLLAWLTGANVYQTTCLDQISKPEYKEPVQIALQKSAHLISNAIYIFSELKSIVKIFDLRGAAGVVLGDNGMPSGPVGLLSGSLNTKGGLGLAGNNDNSPSDDPSTGSRRLLNAKGGEGRSGYPSWVTMRDRRLLQDGQGGSAKPNAVVAKDGSGQFSTITDAINSINKTKKGEEPRRFVIYVKAGIYDEVVLIKKKSNVFIYGDGQGKTIITGDLSVALKRVKTSNSATIGVDADGFMIRSVTIRNTAGPDGHQAVALRIAGQFAVVYDCSIEAYQDTLYYHRGKQFYKNCVISGTVDFIFGNGRAVIQDSLIIARKPNPNQNNMVTADGGLTPQGEHGLVIQNCRITAENDLMAEKSEFKTYLGRPWKAYALTVTMQSEIGDFVAPEGYSIFTNVGVGSTNQNSAIYGEYQNIGPGANVEGRDRNNFKNWQLLGPSQAQFYTIGIFLDGGIWLSKTGVPYKLGL